MFFFLKHGVYLYPHIRTRVISKRYIWYSFRKDPTISFYVKLLTKQLLYAGGNNNYI